ncbi:MAG: hypothetical protein C0403_10870 [Desulfobacterium sp.]|nr:hypothetical protein [Desulfobacterium sp.]
MKTAVTVFSLLFILLSPNLSAAQDNHFIIGVEELDYLPFYSGEGKTYSGYARELLDAFAKERGYSFDYRPLPVKRLLDTFLKNKVDFKFPDNSNWQTDLKKGFQIIYSEPAIVCIDGVLVLPNNKGRGIEHLKKLGTVLGFTAWDYLDHIKQGTIAISENSSFQGLLKQVIIGRIDGAYINPEVARYQLERIMNQPRALVFDPVLPHTQSAYLLSTIKHPNIILEFNRFLKDKAALVEQLKKSHFMDVSNTP